MIGREQRGERRASVRGLNDAEGSYAKLTQDAIADFRREIRESAFDRSRVSKQQRVNGLEDLSKLPVVWSARPGYGGVAGVRGVEANRAARKVDSHVKRYAGSYFTRHPSPFILQ